MCCTFRTKTEVSEWLQNIPSGDARNIISRMWALSWIKTNPFQTEAESNQWLKTMPDAPFHQSLESGLQWFEDIHDEEDALLFAEIAHIELPSHLRKTPLDPQCPTCSAAKLDIEKYDLVYALSHFIGILSSAYIC